jgi:Na+/H+-dicarboxylate symporter
MFRTWQAITLWKRVLIGLVLGGCLGLIFYYGIGDKARSTAIVETWFKPFGDGFIRLIQMLIVPLITTTIITGVTSMGDAKKLGTIGIRAMSLFLLTTFFAVWLGLGIGSLIKPGKGVPYEKASKEAVEDVNQRLDAGKRSGSISQQILDIIPRNPIQSLAQGDVVPIIFFSLIIGVGILLTGESAKPMQVFFESASRVVLQITLAVMELAPFGVFALMAWVMGSMGISVLNNLFWLLVALYAACLIQIVFVYGLILVKGFARLPLLPFFRGIFDAQGVAFSVSSSSATLPVSISCAEKNLGIHKSVADSVLPLGATINMDGTSIYLGLIALFGAQAVGVDLSWGTYLSIALTATMISIGVAGVPSASLLYGATVLGLIGLDQTQSALVVAFIFPFDRLLDMMRTLTNVTGDLSVTSVVANWEGAIDREAFAAANRR